MATLKQLISAHKRAFRETKQIIGKYPTLALSTALYNPKNWRSKKQLRKVLNIEIKKQKKLKANIRKLIKPKKNPHNPCPKVKRYTFLKPRHVRFLKKIGERK